MAKKTSKKVEDIEAPKQEQEVKEDAPKKEQDKDFAYIMSLING